MTKWPRKASAFGFLGYLPSRTKSRRCGHRGDELGGCRFANRWDTPRQRPLQRGNLRQKRLPL